MSVQSDEDDRYLAMVEGQRARALAEVERLKAEVAYLRALCVTIIETHAEVVMDTKKDRDLHDRAVGIFRDSLSVAHLAGTP